MLLLKVTCNLLSVVWSVLFERTAVVVKLVLSVSCILLVRAERNRL